MAPTQDPESLTVLLHAWKGGDEDARQQAWSQIYNRLHKLAHHVLRGRNAVSAMGTTTVLHEAAIELLGMDVDWQNSEHFYAAAARCMRFVLVDAARRKLAHKRGSGRAADELNDDQVLDASARPVDEILAVHQALERLAAIDERQAELVELRYFGGMTVDETAKILGVSKPTAVRQWRAARVWLYGQLQS